MRIRSLIYGLAVLFFVGSGAETWSQECYVPRRRPASLIDLFQRRLCRALCDGAAKSCQKADVPKSAIPKAAPVKELGMVEKPIPIQRHPCVGTPACTQKVGCRREVSDMIAVCQPCGFRRPRPVSNLLSRWQRAIHALPPFVSGSPCRGGKGESNTKHVAKKGCGCEPDVHADFSTPIPMIEKPQIQENPFQDDALQPAPLPNAPSSEAQGLPRSVLHDASAGSGQQLSVRFAPFYELPVQFD